MIEIKMNAIEIRRLSLVINMEEDVFVNDTGILGLKQKSECSQQQEHYIILTLYTGFD